MNVMVMAGTKDAANIIKKLSSTQKFSILATTTTSYGADIAKTAGADKVISKGLTLEELIEVIKTNDINILVDATHPFAANATYNAINSSKITGITYLRFERPLEDFKENDLIHEVSSFEEAALKAGKITKGRVLHLAGVSTLKPIIDKIDSSRLFARVLPSVNSIQKCIDIGIKQENIIAMQGVFSKEFNKTLFEEYGISLIITKESGQTGGTLSKINAAIELGIDVILVTRPKVAELKNKDIFTDLDEIINFMLKNR
ncbi:precorrin-6A reductase [Methanobacterium sp.]|uniref:precorrin-6A reductase n=1 Tax=Methanobacterium sp. TaxID=2164 RepID=UPI003C7470C2